MNSSLAPNPGKAYRSGKTYTHNVGLSCCFRQWRAESHCHFLHGYALQVELEFRRMRGDLDDNNWVQDFGGLKGIKKWLEDTFDHKLLVAWDDPEGQKLKELAIAGVADVVIVNAVGCEAFARMIYDHANFTVGEKSGYTVFVETVTVREHAGNWASYGAE